MQSEGFLGKKDDSRKVRITLMKLTQKKSTSSNENKENRSNIAI
jgi:hypothetical protein